MVWLRCCIPVFLLIMSGSGFVGAGNVLFFHNLGSKSHLYTLFPMVEELLERGHTITGAFYAPSKIKHENYTEILLSNIQETYYKEVSKLYMEEGAQTGVVNFNVMWRTWDKVNMMMNQTFEELKRPDIKALYDQKFDMVVTISWYGLIMADIMDVPAVYVSPIGPFHMIAQSLGIPFNPSFQPVLGSTMTDPTQFSQRLKNVFNYFMIEFFIGVYNFFIINGAREHLGYNGPGFSLNYDRLEMALLNSHFLIHGSQASLQNQIEVGGIHIKETKPLPDDLQKLLDKHPEGVVLVSFGSAIVPSSMSAEKKEIFLRTFRQLGCPIIWKWDSEDMEGVPPNVHVRKWVPQQDLLAHPNLKVFVTHGGLLSTMEAIHFKTAMVGIPFGNDQLPNLMRAEHLNIGIRLDWNTLDVPTFEGAIKKALTDQTIQGNVTWASNIFRDEKDKPVDRATWALEFVMRHKGASMYKSSSLKLRWYEYYLLDIIGLFMVVGSIGLYIWYRIMKWFFFCCCCCMKKKVKKE